MPVYGPLTDRLQITTSALTRPCPLPWHGSGRCRSWPDPQVRLLPASGYVGPRSRLVANIGGPRRSADLAQRHLRPGPEEWTAPHKVRASLIPFQDGAVGVHINEDLLGFRVRARAEASRPRKFGGSRDRLRIHRLRPWTHASGVRGCLPSVIAEARRVSGQAS